VALGRQTGQWQFKLRRVGFNDKFLAVKNIDAAKRAIQTVRLGDTPEGRAALLHALAHIELNAIDLALDVV
jgi:uncharacterized ferritin-like protein (DUF455 family)